MKILTFKQNKETVYVPIKKITGIKVHDNGDLGIQTLNNYWLIKEKCKNVKIRTIDEIIEYIFSEDRASQMIYLDNLM